MTSAAVAESRPNRNAPVVNEAHPEWIVVEDPRREWNEGSLVEAAKARQLASRGVTLMPVVTRYFREGDGGFFKRAWGSGYPLSRDTPRLHCPMVVHLDPSVPTHGVNRGSTCVVHWRARLVSGEPGTRRQGQLRLSFDTGQSVVQQVTFAPGYGGPVNLATIGEPDERGGWTIGGENQANVPLRGHYGFGLYGMGPGLLVTWAALSVTLTSR
jgi:hypothetical protein